MMFDMAIFLRDRPFVMRVGFGDKPEDFLHDLIERLNGVARSLLQLVRLEEEQQRGCLFVSLSLECRVLPKVACDTCAGQDTAWQPLVYWTSAGDIQDRAE